MALRRGYLRLKGKVKYYSNNKLNRHETMSYRDDALYFENFYWSIYEILDMKMRCLPFLLSPLLLFSYSEENNNSISSECVCERENI